MDFTHIKFKKDDAVAEITLDSPPLNILTKAMMEEIEDALHSIEKERGLKLLVVSAKGKVFCAGADVIEHHPDHVHEMMAHFDGVFETLNRLQMPILAEVRGAAFGGGCELALFCDMVLATENAKFGVPEVKLGFFPPVAAVILPQLIGRNRAIEMMVTGRSVGAKEAASWGLINAVFPEGSFDEEARKFKAGITEASPLILRFNKRVVEADQGTGFQRAYGRVGQIFLGELMKTAEVLEGIEAFQQKRKPEWKNE